MSHKASEGSAIRFLTFSNDNEDAEKLAKLKEAACKIEEAIAREKSISELVDYVPVEEPELDIANDTRPLYERLLDQRKKKEDALEESQKLSNLVTKLDEDDATYLNQVAKDKQEDELKKRLEVYDALEGKRRFREKTALEEEVKMKAALVNSKISPKIQNSSIKDRLSSLIKIRPKSQESKFTHSNETQTATGRQTRQSTARLSKQKTNDTNSSTNSNSNSVEDRDKKRLKTSDDEKRGKEEKQKDDEKKTEETLSQECNCNQVKVMRCIGILPSLPIVARDHDSSESEQSEEDELLRSFIRAGSRHK